MITYLPVMVLNLKHQVFQGCDEIVRLNSISDIEIKTPRAPMSKSQQKSKMQPD